MLSTSLSINSRSKLLLIAGFVVGALCLIVLGAFAQSATGCPDGPDCVFADDFETDVDEWAVKTNGDSVTWLDSKVLGQNSPAYGVLKFSSIYKRFEMHKEITLASGTYRLKWRGGRDFSPFFQPNMNILISQNDMDRYVSICDGPAGMSEWYFDDYTSCTFVISDPGIMQIKIVFTEVDAYFDHIWLETAVAPTPLPGTGTATPPLWTPIATQYWATPQPTGTPYCADVQPTATGPAPYVTPGAPTPTPVPTEQQWYFLDTFKEFGVSTPWKKLGWVVSRELNHTTDYTGNGSASVFVGYNGQDSTISMTVSLSNALILEQPNFPSLVHIVGWAMADVVPIGETGYVEVWVYDPTSYQWMRADQFAISSGRWYPFTVDVNLATGYGQPAIAFVGNRSDNPVAMSGGIYLDDLYFWASESLTPHCNGTYPDGVVDNTGNTVGADYDAGTTSMYFNWPADRACPKNLNVPNNFWGALLAQLTLFIDNTFAFAPLHYPGELAALVYNMLISPVGMVFVFASILFDWRVPLGILLLWLSIQVIFLPIVGYKALRRSVIQ